MPLKNYDNIATCESVTFVNFIFKFFASWRASSPDLKGTSIVGVLMFALAVINISLLNVNRVKQ